MLTGLHHLLDRESIGSSACEGYLRTVARSYSNHPGSHSGWLL